MRRRLVWTLTLLCSGAGLLLSGCADPCAELADKACTRAGNDSEVCKQVQAVARQPTHADQEACRAGVAFALQLEKR